MILFLLQDLRILRFLVERDFGQGQTDIDNSADSIVHFLLAHSQQGIAAQGSEGDLEGVGKKSVM